VAPDHVRDPQHSFVRVPPDVDLNGVTDSMTGAMTGETTDETTDATADATATSDAPAIDWRQEWVGGWGMAVGGPAAVHRPATAEQVAAAFAAVRAEGASLALRGAG
jgi:hypothetical protein